MTCERLLQISARIGRGLIESGAEAYRVEDSLHYVIEAYGLGSCQIFSIPNYLHIHLTDNEGKTHSCMSRASSLKGVDIDKLNALNDLCRTIAVQKPTAAEILDRLDAIENTQQFSVPMQMVSYAVGSGGFALFWGGVMMDAVAAAIVGAIVAVAMYIMGRLEANLFFKSLIGSAISALLTCAFIHIGIGVNRDEIIIGVFMMLLPGLMITNFMREIIVGDWLSGIIKLMQAVLIAGAIALGTGIVLAFI